MSDADASAAPLPVSVVIAAYNREDLVSGAVRSALAQVPRPPAEVIVVDDCSSDTTAANAERAGARVIRHSRNRGNGASRNTGFAAATQPWVAQLDSDDEWLPHHLATLWHHRDGHVFVSACSLGVRDGDQRVVFGGTGRRRVTPIRTPASLIYPENFVSSSGVIMRRDAVEAVGGYNPELRVAEDMDLWIRLLERGSAVVVPRPVNVYRLHRGQITADEDATRDGFLAVAASYADRPWWSNAHLERARAVAAWDRLRSQLRTGNRREALSEAVFVARSPTRTLAVVGIWIHRERLKRRASTVARDGSATVALLSDDPVARARAGTNAVDLSGLGLLRALLRLARRPTAAAVVGSRREAALMRLLGIRPIR